MATTLGILKGLLGILSFDKSGFADDGRNGKLPEPERNAFFKIYTGLDHGSLTTAEGDLPDARRKQNVSFPLASAVYLTLPSVNIARLEFNSSLLTRRIRDKLADFPLFFHITVADRGCRSVRY